MRIIFQKKKKLKKRKCTKSECTKKVENKFIFINTIINRAIFHRVHLSYRIKQILTPPEFFFKAQQKIILSENENIPSVNVKNSGE